MVKDGMILYISQYEAVQDLSDEELGKLYRALFNEQIRQSGKDPKYEVELTGATLIAYNFLVNQLRIDIKKYDDLCKRNKENGKKGGRPRKNPEKANGFFKNPNENDNENEKENEKKKDNENESDVSSGSLLFGSLHNVELTESEHDQILDQYEDAGTLINNVSNWLPKAKNPVPDHFGLVLTFANKSGWPKKRRVKPPPPEREIAPEDMPTEEELAEIMESIRSNMGFVPVG